MTSELSIFYAVINLFLFFTTEREINNYLLLITSEEILFICIKIKSGVLYSKALSYQTKYLLEIKFLIQTNMIKFIL